jgi:hypothetical protein
MIWQTWRQHRVAAGVAAVIVAGLASAILAVGIIARRRASALGLPDCLAKHGDCSNAINGLHRDFHSIPPVTGALVAIPLLAGMFWAAPLVSREYEAGTHRLAWTQSISPLRWITTKIALIFGVLAIATAALAALTTWALDPLDVAFGGRFNSTWYDISGVVPVACMLFALALGVALSALIRRTIPAMAITLVGYAAARIPIHWIRAHFAPVTVRTLKIPLAAFVRDPGGDPRDRAAAVVSPGDWLQHMSVTDAAGNAVPTYHGNLGLIQYFCSNVDLIARSGTGDVKRMSQRDLTNVAACLQRTKNVDIVERISYQPAAHFWYVQAVESLLFVGVAAALVTLAILAVTRRRVF